MNNNDYANQIVWIVGASSGIGLSLAQELSSRGATLALSSRRKDELERLNVELGGRHKVFALDVTDTDATSHTAQAVFSTFDRIDRFVFLAAAYAPMRFDTLDILATKRIVDANVNGVFNFLNAVLPLLKMQKTKGQIAVCGSVAGYIGLPGGQPYSATKAAIINIVESLYAEYRDVLDVKLISPGFVRTPMTGKNEFAMPMIIEPEEAATQIADGLLSKHFEIHFPKKFTMLVKLLRILPYALSLRITPSFKS